MKYLISIALLASSFTMATAMAAEDYQDSPDSVIVTVDRAKVYRIAEPARTVIVGNPSIADVTIEDERTLVLTGRSFGVTNLIVLGKGGDPLVDIPVVVRGHEINTVRIYRRENRETMACAPICEPTLTIGDNNSNFQQSGEQIQLRNSLNDATASAGQNDAPTN